MCKSNIKIESLTHIYPTNKIINEEMKVRFWCVNYKSYKALAYRFYNNIPLKTVLNINIICFKQLTHTLLGFTQPNNVILCSVIIQNILYI